MPQLFRDFLPKDQNVIDKTQTFWPQLFNVGRQLKKNLKTEK